MQRRLGPLASARRSALAALLSVGLAAGGLAPRALADSGAGPSLYGKVVDVGPTAIVLALQNGEWVAVNLTPQTVVASQSGGPASIAGIQDGDWALVTYAVSRQGERGGQGGGTMLWIVARTVTYATSPISTGGQQVHITGRVSGLAAPLGGGGLTFSVTAAGGAVWSVQVTSQTTVLLGATVAPLAFLQLGDIVQVWGTAVGHDIVASKVVYRVSARSRSRPRRKDT